MLKFNITDVHNLKDSELLTGMNKGVLYHLQYRHPVIDGVGLLEMEGKIEPWLVFIQVSLSSYTNHRSKMPDLFQRVMCPELKSSDKTIFSYYYKMNSEVLKKRYLYVYISPKENDVENFITGHTQHKIKHALVQEGSVTQIQLQKIVACL